MKRIESFDLARGLAIFFMIVQHVVLTYGTPQVNNSDIGGFILLLGYSAAPVFLFLMGVFFIYSKKRTVDKLYRGLKLFLLGYLLNFFHLTLPIIIGLKLGILTPETVQYHSLVESFFIIDLLQFAGLAYVIMALLEKSLKKIYLFVLLAFIVGLVSPILSSLYTGNMFFDCFLKTLWGTDETVVFPLLPWLAYPLFGIAFGMVLKKADNANVFFKKSTNIGFLLLIFGALVCLTNLSSYFENHYWNNFGVMILWFGFILVWLPICRWIVDKFPSRIKDILFYWSKNITVVYCIQWVIISWGILLLGGMHNQELPIVLLLMVVVMVLTHLSTKIYNLKYS